MGARRALGALLGANTLGALLLRGGGVFSGMKNVVQHNDINTNGVFFVPKASLRGGIRNILAFICTSASPET